MGGGGGGGGGAINPLGPVDGNIRQGWKTGH